MTAEHAVENVGSLFELQADGVGQQTAAAVIRADRIAPPRELDKPLRLADRQRPDQYLVQQREDAGIRTDAECERNQRRRREALAARQRSHAVLCVTPEIFGPTDTSRVENLLLNQADVPERAQGGRACLLSGESLGSKHLDLPFEMVRQFGVKVLIDLTTVEQGTETKTDDPSDAHGRQAGPTIREIAVDSRSHCAASCFRARRPSRVSV